MTFVNLHAHSEYSIADGLFAPSKWAEALESRGYKAHALTDHGTMAGHLPFYKAMKDRKLIPILGCEFYYANNPEIKTPENRHSSHLILIAKNYDGYRNLLKLQKLSFTDGFYYRPRIGLEWLRQYHEGLVCLTACLGGVLSHAVRQEFAAKEKGEVICGLLEAEYLKFAGIFGDDFYVEFQSHNDKDQMQQKIQAEFYDRLRLMPGFKQICTNDCHYILQEHSQIQTILKENAYAKKSETSGSSYTTTDSLWLKQPIDIARSFRDFHGYMPNRFWMEGMAKTQEVLDKCVGFEFPKGKRYLPVYDKAGTDSKAYFRELTIARLGAFLRSGTLHATPEKYKERFAKEFGTIKKYNLEDYFLIVWDIVNYAQKNGIYVGLGRGSAAGCLISYLLGIVRIDPLEYGLIFERFLNETRCESGELPDIDLDFESHHRTAIKQYIFDTYGNDKVCEIGTYGRIKLKTGILDFGASLKVADRSTLLNITTNLDLDKGLLNSLEEACKADARLEGLVAANPYFGFAVKEIIGNTRGGPGEGQIKSVSVHPAGVIISNESVAEITPVKSQVSKETGDRILTTQAEDKYLIAQGMVKMDVLGIKEYDIVRSILENAPDKRFTVDNYVEKIMADEAKYQELKGSLAVCPIVPHLVWDYFKIGRTDGVFQFSSDGMKQLLVQMQADHVEDLIAANALFRPGCLENGWHTQYCDRKHGKEAVSYVHPDLEKTLGSTYGVIVYQEQFMSIFHLLGGIPLVESDVIRSALGKKDKVKLAKFKDQFVKGATPKLGAEVRALEVWEQIEKASGYSFNKSHSASYSVLAYISQYLKVLYPALFWASHLDWDTVKNDQESVTAHRRAAKEQGVQIARPHINESKAKFVGDEARKWVRWGFQGIKGIGEGPAEAIEKGQPYADFDAFLNSPEIKGKVKWNHLIALAYAGVFDSFMDRRELIKYLHVAKKKLVPALAEKDLIMGYKESMGFFEQSLKKRVIGWDKDIMGEPELLKYMDGLTCVVGGLVTSVKRVKTKKGDAMGFLTLTDQDEEIQVVIFPSQWLKFRTEIAEGKVIEVHGTKNVRNGIQNQVVADKVIELSW